MRKAGFFLGIVCLAAVLLTACSAAKKEAGPAQNNADLKAVLLIPGTLGDKSFFDAANAGLQRAARELGAGVKVIEMGTDRTKYEPVFMDVCGEDWDLILGGGPDVTDLFNQFCKDFPDQVFINYDATNDSISANVYSVSYAANELSYMSGVVAALTTESAMEHANEALRIGFIGGMDIPGINDFLVGYLQGAGDVNKDIKVVISYAQDFANPGKGKELAINQYDSGVDVIFSAAGGTGLGVLDAAAEKKRYAIGVDSDQALLFKDTDPAKAALIITSAIKRIDQVVFDAIKMHKEGGLSVGSYKVLGIKEKGVGIARNELYEAAIPAEIRAKVDGYEEKLAKGEIKVVTAIGMDQSALNQMRNSFAP
jgi:basic membrane protein A